MTILRLVTKEILHRKVNFILGLLSVVVAVVCLLGAIASLRGYDLRTEAIVEAKQAETEQRMNELEETTRREMAKLEDEIRKIMKGLGFNIYIFPEGQDLSEVYSEGYASKTMPEEYVDKLAASDIVTVNHLLPSLTQKADWPEKKRKVILVGIRGEVPLKLKDPKKPLLKPVPEGKVVLGYELHRSLDLSEGDGISFKGKEFTVHKCHAERGTADDITVWMNLREAQALLSMEGRINAIQALECNCATVDRLGDVRKEISAILPDTQVIEKGSKALARAEARLTAKKTAEKQFAEARDAGRREINAARLQRAELKEEREAVAAALAPSIIVLCVVWIAFLTFTNVRERTQEIGILRAIGVGSRSILMIFLFKACLMGALGAGLGCLALLGLGDYVSEAAFSGYAIARLVPFGEIVLVIAIAPLVACGAAWLPALAASQQDPAVVLRGE